jgi:predicted nucleotide-binding protein
MAVTSGGSIRDRLMAQLHDGDGITDDGAPDQWISAEQAVELPTPARKSTYITQKTICARAHNGLIRSRAEQLKADQAIFKTHTVPAEFWWAEGEAALTQNWRTGDFDTWIDQEVHLRAFGVRFFRADIEKLIPPGSANPENVVPQFSATISTKVFLVHGRDDGAKNEVALFLRTIGLEPVILHLRPNGGRHLLTKFREESDGAGFAVVLMTPDDEGGIAGGNQQPRARQNVVFELGFFIGKLGPENVAALLKGDVEKPSDFDGIAYIGLDSGGQWKTILARELHHAKVPFDPAKALTA